MYTFKIIRHFSFGENLRNALAIGRKIYDACTFLITQGSY